MTEIKKIISGLFYKNEEAILTFFNQIEDEPNFSFFLLDYHGEYDSETLYSEIESLIRFLLNEDYIQLKRRDNNNNTFIVEESNQKFIFETNYIFRKGNMKSKKLEGKASDVTFEKIKEIIENNEEGTLKNLIKMFFNQLRTVNEIKDFDQFEKTMRPENLKNKMVDEIDVIDACLNLSVAGVIKYEEKKDGKTFFTIPNTKITFSITDAQMVDRKGKLTTKKEKVSSGSKIKNILNKKSKPKPVTPPFNMSDKDIEERAKAVIKSAKENTPDEVINIFEKISLPFNGANYKRQLFEKIFELAEVNGEWRNDIGYVIFSKKRTRRAVVSHMDLISPFNRGFAKGRVYKIEDDKLIGALDNTFTNAVVINSILNGMSDDTTYLFTLDEETNQYAIRDYMKLFGNEQFIINLDITNEGMKNNVAVEYDKPSWEICKQINENLDDPFFTKDRVCDDMDEVIKADGKGFSYCIPSGKTIHSYSNYTYLKNIKPYMDGLDFMIHDMCLESCEPNVSFISIKKALKCKTLNKLKKRDVKKTYKSKYGNTRRTSHHYPDDSSVGHQQHLDFDDGSYENNYEQENEAAVNYATSSLIMYIAEDTCISEHHLLEPFVSRTLHLDEFFYKETFVEVSNERTFSVLVASDLIKEVEDRKYVFNKEYFYTNRFKILKMAKEKAIKLDFVKFAKFLGGLDTQETFSMMSLETMHIEKDLDVVAKMQDYMAFFQAIITYDLVLEDGGTLTIKE